MSVRLYVRNECIQSNSVKMFLSMLGVPFEERNVDENESFSNDLMLIHEQWGRETVPVITGDEFDPIFGFDPDELKLIFGEL